MTFLKQLATWLLILPLLALSAGAQEAEPVFPEPLSETLSDFAQVLTATEEGRISRLLAELRETTGVQVVVVTAAGLESLNGGGLRLEAFGKALFDAWGIGDGKADDGILIVIDTVAREARITLGAGYAPVYDDRAARVLSTALLPELRAGRMAAGIEAGLIAARDKLIVPFQAGEPVGPTDGFETGGSGGSWPVTAGFAGVMGIGLVAIWQRLRARRICPQCRTLGLKRTNEVIAQPTRFQAGLGLQHISCPSCGYVDRKPYPIRQSSPGTRRSRDDRGNAPRDSGSGDGGFGGGKSDGGGASGKW